MDCNNCTLCCKLANISDTKSLHGEYCKKCSPDVGCLIYSTRPSECRTFQCAYSQMTKVKPELQPNKCGVMFEKINDTLMLATTVFMIESLSPLIRGQILSFNKEGISVLLQKFKPHKFVCFKAPGAIKQEIIQALEDKSK